MSAQSKTVIGFSVKVPKEDADLVDECVVDMLDDLDVDLDGDLQWLWWHHSPTLIHGALYGSIAAKSSIKDFSKRDEIATAKTMSVASLLDKTTTMKQLTASTDVRATDSKTARKIIEQWQHGRGQRSASDQLADLNLRERKEGESLSDHFLDMVSEIQKVDWSDSE